MENHCVSRIPRRQDRCTEFLSGNLRHERWQPLRLGAVIHRMHHAIRWWTYITLMPHVVSNLLNPVDDEMVDKYPMQVRSSRYCQGDNTPCGNLPVSRTFFLTIISKHKLKTAHPFSQLQCKQAVETLHSNTQYIIRIKKMQKGWIKAEFLRTFI